MISKIKYCMLILYSMFMFVGIHVNAQTGNKTITGTVVDSQQEPAIGASVAVKGTTNATMTDVDGKFTLNVPQNATIVVSYLGYVTQEIETTAQSEYNITLQENAMNLDEVVVVGYGTMRKKDLTGSIVQIRPDNIAVENPKTVQDILRGTPGLNVGYDASAKGGGSLEIRGQRSTYTANNHNSPLLILDGMAFNGELSEINPDDIEQIDILKDASAAAVYGAKSANGVILITTKKGKLGKPVINVTANFGLSQLSTYRERFSPEDYLQHRQDWLTRSTYGLNPATGIYDAYQSGTLTSKPGYYSRPDQLGNLSLDAWRAYDDNISAETSDLSVWAQRLGFKGNALNNILAGKTENWKKRAFRLGFNQDYNASVSGASERANYYFSMGYLKNEGVVRSDGYRAIRANMKVNMKVTNWFEIGANVNFQDRSDGNIDLDVGATLQSSPYGDYGDEFGNPIQYPLDENYSQRGYNYDFRRQHIELEKGYTVLNNILNAKISLPYNITYTFNAAPRFQFFYDRYFVSSKLPGVKLEDQGANREQRKRFDWSINNTINWDYTFNKKHHFVLTLVQEAEELQSWKDYIGARVILPSDALGFHNTKNGSKEYSSYDSEDTRQTADALLARLFYSYDDRYMITGSVRRDGYSAFGGSNPHATFPSVALAWTFTNENFFKWTDIMSHGKLRLSYGENGNRSLDNPYIALSNLSAGGGNTHAYYNESGEIQLRYLMADRMANPTLKWEKTESWNLGLDYGFLNGRISGNLDYYFMKTRGMIMNRRIPEFTGFSNITTNLGQVNNSGIEITINSLNIDNKDFKWNTTFGFAYNKNEIKHLYGDYEDILDANGNVVGRREMDDKTNGWFIGQPISAIWGYRVDGIWQKDEYDEAKRHGQEPGDPKVANLYTADDKINADGSITPVYNDNDKVILGQKSAPYRLSMRNEFTLWKDLTVSFNIYSYLGHKSLSGNYLNDDDNGGRMSYGMASLPDKEYWTIDNPSNKYARINAKGPQGALSPGRLYNRSFVRLENISIGYTLPKKLTSKLDLERVKVFSSIRNVAVWSKDWEYGDPESGDWGSRIYTFGLNLTF